jgi:hypothetical protein
MDRQEPNMTKTPTSEMQLRPLDEAELQAVSGAAGLPSSQIAGSVEAAKKQELAERLQKAYISSHPFDYYGYFG